MHLALVLLRFTEKYSSGNKEKLNHQLPMFKGKSYVVQIN